MPHLYLQDGQCGEDNGMEDEDEAYDTYLYYNQNEDEYLEDIQLYQGEAVAEEEAPQELGEASLMVEDAYISYLDSRRKMRELALSRGFYPVVAIDMNDNYNKGTGRAHGKARNTGRGTGPKGKSKGKGGGKSKGKGSPTFCVWTEVQFRWWVHIDFHYGTLNDEWEHITTWTSLQEVSAADIWHQRSPRRSQNGGDTSGATPIPGEFHRHEETNFGSPGVGWAIMDSGATRSLW